MGIRYFYLKLILLACASFYSYMTRSLFPTQSDPAYYNLVHSIVFQMHTCTTSVVTSCWLPSWEHHSKPLASSERDLNMTRLCPSRIHCCYGPSY